MEINRSEQNHLSNPSHHPARFDQYEYPNSYQFHPHGNIFSQTQDTYTTEILCGCHSDFKCDCSQQQQVIEFQADRRPYNRHAMHSQPNCNTMEERDHPIDDPIQRFPPSKQTALPPSPTGIRPISISRRQILSKLNADNEFGRVGQLHCSTILRRAQSQPTFGQYGGSEETNDFDDEIDEIDEIDDDEAEEELFGQFGNENEMYADMNGNFKQSNINLDHHHRRKDTSNRIDPRTALNNRGAAKALPSRVTLQSIGDHNNNKSIMLATNARASNRQRLFLNGGNGGRGSTGASLTLSSTSSESSHRSAIDSPITQTNASSLFLQPLPPPSAPAKEGHLKKNVISSRKPVPSTLGRKDGPKTHPTVEQKHMMNAFERSLANLDPNMIQADVLQSEIYNSEHSARISQLKEITNMANNQVVLSTQEESQAETWYNKRKLYDDHITEIVDKWTTLDEEIWCKLICMERNRRVAKAYIRLPYLIVTGSATGFDGYIIGLGGFDNTHRDQETKYILENLEKGVRIKMDECGNLIMRRMCSATVQIKDWLQQLTEGTGALGEEVIALHGRLPLDRAVKVFDMQRFERNLQMEMAKKRPDIKRLTDQCILPIAFGKNTFNLINSPLWVMSINVIALRMIFQAFSVWIPEPDYGETTCEEESEKMAEEEAEREEAEKEEAEEKKEETKKNQSARADAVELKKEVKKEEESEEERSGQASDEAAHIYNSI